LVINYDLPTTKEKYIHRIGRSGRFGRKGVAVNFVTPADAKFLQETEKFYNTEIVEMPLDLTNLFDWEKWCTSKVNLFYVYKFCLRTKIQLMTVQMLWD